MNSRCFDRDVTEKGPKEDLKSSQGGPTRGSCELQRLNGIADNGSAPLQALQLISI
jgi:hypothetical protein